MYWILKYCPWKQFMYVLLLHVMMLNYRNIRIFVFQGITCTIFSVVKYLIKINRDNHRRGSIEKGVLKSFTKFTRKHLCRSMFFNEVAGWGSATLLKKRLRHRCFPVNFAKFLRTPILEYLLASAPKSKIKTLEQHPWMLFGYFYCWLWASIYHNEIKDCILLWSVRPLRVGKNDITAEINLFWHFVVRFIQLYA